MPLGLFKERRLAMAAGLLLGGLVFAYLLWPAPKNGPAIALPVPNGYDDLLRAAMKVPTVAGNYRDWSHDQLATFVRTNTAILDEARLGLSRSCQVPIEFAKDYFSRHLPELSAIKYLAYFLSATGRLAEMERRPADAAKSYLDSIRLGQQSARGGFPIDLLVGIACEDMGLAKLEKLTDHLDFKSVRDTIRVMDELETNRPPIEAVLTREEEWDRRVATIHERVASMWAWKSINPSRKSAQRITSRMNAAIRRHRVLMLQFAARAFELEQGDKPASAEQLVPAYLPAIPVDPESGTNLTLLTPSR